MLSDPASAHQHLAGACARHSARGSELIRSHSSQRDWITSPYLAENESSQRSGGNQHIKVTELENGNLHGIQEGYEGWEDLEVGTAAKGGVQRGTSLVDSRKLASHWAEGREAHS